MGESPLFVEERHAKIVEYVEHRRTAAVGELCEHFGVSGATMRNDLRALENAGLIARTHGGAMRKSKTGLELDSFAKEVHNREAKEAIAQAALPLIEDGDTIVLDTGTTVLALARLLGAREGLTAVTNDLSTALVLEELPDITIIFMGGIVRKRFHCTVAHGEPGDSDSQALTVDKAFMGTNSLSVEHGASTPDLATAHAKRGMIAMASSVIVLCDSSKFERTSLAQFATLDQIDVLVTETSSGGFLDQLIGLGVEVLCGCNE
jgi:DeoR family transcriptional regulator, fructose operon transcriptional repressor